MKHHSHDSTEHKRPDHLLGVLLWLAIAAVFAFFAYIQIERDYFGRVFDGEIIGKRAIVRGSRHRTTFCDIQYAFIADDGQRHTGSDNVGAFWNEQDWEAYHQAEPGLKVHVQATNALGIYYTSFFTTNYQPWRKLIGLLVTASATCLSVSLLFFLDTVLPPRRQKIAEREERTQRTAAAIETSGRIPPELAQPLPRRVRFRKKDRSLSWITFFLPLPFLLIGSYLVLLALWLGMERSFVGCVVISIAALAWNALWLGVVYGLVTERWITKRLCQWGRAAEGSIVTTSQKRGKKSEKYYLECQYMHPGLGLRKIRIRIKPQEYAQSDQERRVTVLCYAHLPWPRQVYEIGNLFRCY